jgi:hypothetical protein
VAHFLRWMKFFVECCAFASKLQPTKSFIYEIFYWVHIINKLKKHKFAPKKFNLCTLTLPKWTYKVENMDNGWCTSIYEQFFVCFEVEISYRDLIYVISYYKESRFFLNVKKWWPTKSYGLWMAWNGYVLYHIIFKFFSTFKFEDFLKWFFSYGLYPLHFDVFKDFQTWHLLGQIFWYRFWHKFIEFFKWVNI